MEESLINMEDPRYELLIANDQETKQKTDTFRLSNKMMPTDAGVYQTVDTILYQLPSH